MTHEERQEALRKLARERAERMKQLAKSHEDSAKRMRCPLANQIGFSLFKKERV